MIISPNQSFQVYIRPGETDMKKSINGLSGIVQNEIKLNPYDPFLFNFSNRKKNPTVFPLHRQEAILHREEIEISRRVMAENAILVSEGFEQNFFWWK